MPFYRSTASAWGRHTLPTPTSPDVSPALTLSSTHLGVVFRLCSAPTWKSLVAQIQDLVPWQRPKEGPLHYDDERLDGGPARNVERKERKKAGRPKTKGVVVEDD